VISINPACQPRLACFHEIHVPLHLQREERSIARHQHTYTCTHAPKMASLAESSLASVPINGLAALQSHLLNVSCPRMSQCAIAIVILVH